MARFQNGWVKIHRSLLDGGYDAVDIGFITWLVMAANYEDGKSKVGKKLERVVVKRGQIVTSIAEITKALTMTPQMVRSRLHSYAREGILTNETTNTGTIITILNYEKYQCSEIDHQQTEQQTDNKQITNKEQTNNKQITNKEQHIKEVKNLRKEETYIRDHGSENEQPENQADNAAALVEAWNETLAGVLPKVTRLTDKRKKHINAQLKKCPDISYWKNVFGLVKSSDFLTGGTETWKCSFDWILNENNRTKVEEGNYANKGTGAQKSAWHNSGYGAL